MDIETISQREKCEAARLAVAAARLIIERLLAEIEAFRSKMDGD